MSLFDLFCHHELEKIHGNTCECGYFFSDEDILEKKYEEASNQ